MPALFPLRLALTKEQDEWLKKRSLALGESQGEIVSSLLDAEIGGENMSARLAELARLLAESEPRSRRMEVALTNTHEVMLAYVKELFRESSANLYRLNAAIDNMPDSILVRQKVNEYVRGREREMGEKLRALHLDGTDR